MEVVELKKNDAQEIIKFLKEYILLIFGVPNKFIIDNGSIFIGSKSTNFCGEYGIIMSQSSNYYPQGNFLVQSRNKTRIQILKKTIDKNKRNFHLKLTDALWENIMNLKDNIGMSPHILFYGKEVKITISIEFNALISVVNTKYTEDNSPIQRRIDQLLKLEEE